MFRSSQFFFSWAAIVVTCLTAPLVRAQGGPPFITNDPGTPGNGNWEINLGWMPTVQRDVTTSQLPQIDINFGLGDRMQLTYEVPYVTQTSAGGEQESAWGNGYPGIKWRFLDQGEGGWQLSTFPQVGTSASLRAQREGIAEDGPRVLLPLEVAKSIGSIGLNFEVGYYLPGHGPEERILGLVVGHNFTRRFELDAEIYDDHAMGGQPQNTTWDIGGRYQFDPAFILLFMAGRAFADSGTQPRFMGYLGIQILLTHYGRSLATGS